MAALAPARQTAAQIPDSQSSQTSRPAEQAPDPLGRRTPRGTFAGFTSAVRAEDFVRAQGYLQPTRRQRPSAERLVRDLAALIDRYYTDPITALSASPNGVPDDGLPLDRERIEFSLPDTTAAIGLVRVNDPRRVPSG